MSEFASFALVPEQGVVPELTQLDEDMQQRIRQMAARLDVRDGAPERIVFFSILLPSISPHWR